MKYKCMVKNPYNNSYSILESSKGQTKKAFIKNIRMNGLKVSNHKVKPAIVWDYIMENTNCEKWFWTCLNTEKDLSMYQIQGNDFIDRKLEKRCK